MVSGEGSTSAIIFDSLFLPLLEVFNFVFWEEGEELQKTFQHEHKYFVRTNFYWI